ncbi:MAG: XdhC family protein [Gammaproteobacteria bacterium]|nr:XdhC family protein [Gammaproteobacteria bacterium]
MQRFGTDQEVLQIACEWLEQGHEVALVTVLKTWGSSPRAPGSLLVMRRDGIHSGSVSGGCVEEDLVQRYRDQQLSDSFPTRVDYGVNRVEATRFGLPCGGRLELLVEQLDDSGQLQSLLDALRQQQLITRQVDLQTGKITLQAASAEESFVYSHSYVRKVFGAQWKLLLIGAGHLSHYVSQMALMLGYRVIVCDPRDEYAQNWKVEGTELTTLMPDEAVQSYAQQAQSIVVALTHDPKLDDMALVDALGSPAFYVGAIGSRRNCESRRQRLKQFGLTPGQLQRLHAPTGLPIGSHTPPEIALSILAEITQQRNTVSGSIKQSVSMV